MLFLALSSRGCEPESLPVNTRAAKRSAAVHDKINLTKSTFFARCCLKYVDTPSTPRYTVSYIVHLAGGTYRAIDGQAYMKWIPASSFATRGCCSTPRTEAIVHRGHACAQKKLFYTAGHLPIKRCRPSPIGSSVYSQYERRIGAVRLRERRTVYSRGGHSGQQTTPSTRLAYK